ncbi:MAG: hypothetical protein M1819_004857 [Sarea resinae]|nr:MAG: hypothetical protein M1819_004857 [Sarea resinae]
MPATDSPAVLVARFLKSNNYDETLDLFLREAGLPSDASTVDAGDLTIENVLQEKKIFDLSVRFEKIGIGEDPPWLSPAPSEPTTLTTLPSASNLLSVSIERIKTRSDGAPAQHLLATTADRRLHVISTDPTSYALVASHAQLHDSPILSCAVVSQRWLITTSMSGQVLLYDFVTKKTLDERRDHAKYVIKVAVWEDEDKGDVLVATAGWDAKVLIYRLHGLPGLGYERPEEEEEAEGEGSEDQARDIKFNEPVASIALPTNPEAILFAHHPNSTTPILILTRRDSTFLYFYSIPSPPSSTPSNPSAQLLGKQNLAPHSNAWISFSPSSIAISPTDPTLIAIATSTVPYMKLILARLLLPMPTPPSTPQQPHQQTQDSLTQPSPHPNQAAQARSELATQDAEAAAILSHTSTLATQTAYSTPLVVWRPDGSGVWVNSDDGVVRGVEARSGKVVCGLSGSSSASAASALVHDGHETGAKIRCLWAGRVEARAGEHEEWLLSGGFDKRLVVWRAGRAGGS